MRKSIKPQKSYVTVRVEGWIREQLDAIAASTRRTRSQVAELFLENSLKEENMKENLMFRQGDVLIRKVKSLPKGQRVKRQSGQVLEGEATGHIHRIAELNQAEVLEIGDGLFLSVGENGVSLVHEEHKPIVLPPGDYEVLRQREYSPEAIRNVQD
jgi:hypothetical protein